MSMFDELLARITSAGQRASNQSPGSAAGAGVGPVQQQAAPGMTAGRAIRAPQPSASIGSGSGLGMMAGRDADMWQAPANVVEQDPESNQDLLRRFLMGLYAQQQASQMPRPPRDPFQ